MRKLRWGVLGVAGIAVKKVIPAMQGGERSEIMAIASRDRAKAEKAARDFGIARAVGSYEELLADGDVEAIYNPLPNHLHVPWSIKAAEAGKHVLCEKPIGLSVVEARQLRDARDRTGVKIGEAFMVRTHPQWLKAIELIRGGRIGDLRSIAGFFSYSNANPANIRNILDYGGGALMDIGCYPIFISRLIFDQEPRRALALMERDPQLKVDRLTSAMLDFSSGQSVFTCSTQMVPYQKVQILGTTARIELQIPFNTPPDRPSRLFVDSGADLFGGGMRTEEFPVCDQYTIQGDLFSQAVRHGGEVPTPLEDSILNMAVIEKLQAGESRLGTATEVG